MQNWTLVNEPLPMSPILQGKKLNCKFNFLVRRNGNVSPMARTRESDFALASAFL